MSITLQILFCRHLLNKLVYTVRSERYKEIVCKHAKTSTSKNVYGNIM